MYTMILAVKITDENESKIGQLMTMKMMQ